MKKFFTIIFFAAFIFLAAGCGTESAVENKVDEVKKEAAVKVEGVANEVSQKAAEIANDNEVSPAQEISIGGITPGMTLEEIKKILGEPSFGHKEEFAFASGVEVELDDHSHIAKEIKTRQSGVAAAKGVAVGMSEQNLLDAYGKAACVDHDDGGVEYKYFSADRRQKIEFRVFNGIISEIKCELDD